MINNIQYFNASDIHALDGIVIMRDEVHIWKIRWREMNQFIHKYRKILDPEENRKADKYFHVEDQMRYLTGKIFVKVLIGHYLGVSVDRIQFRIDQYGKPHCSIQSHEERIQFNISHSGEWVFLAFSLDQKVGIDVEERKILRNYQKIAENVFSKEEYEFLVKANDISIFYNIWSAKEAYIKWIGQGLSYDLKSFSVIDSLNGNSGGEQYEYWMIPIHEEGHAGYFVMDNNKYFNKEGRFK